MDIDCFKNNFARFSSAKLFCWDHYTNYQCRTRYNTLFTYGKTSQFILDCCFVYGHSCWYIVWACDHKSCQQLILSFSFSNRLTSTYYPTSMRLLVCAHTEAEWKVDILLQGRTIVTSLLRNTFHITGPRIYQLPVYSHKGPAVWSSDSLFAVCLEQTVNILRPRQI